MFNKVTKIWVADVIFITTYLKLFFINFVFTKSRSRIPICMYMYMTILSIEYNYRSLQTNVVADAKLG